MEICHKCCLHNLSLAWQRIYKWLLNFVWKPIGNVFFIIPIILLNLYTLPAPFISESSIKIKINFSFHAFKAFIKPFEASQRSLKIKI